MPEELRLQAQKAKDATHAVRWCAGIAVATTLALLTSSGQANANPAKPDHGEKIGKIRIPKIHLAQPVFEGGKDFYTSAFPDSLNKGPAHYPGTPFPWQTGTTMFGGHRTTWTHPFRRLNELRRGDLIVIKTKRWGSFHYRVLRVRVEKPKVRAWKAKSGLMLTACHPPGSDRQRIVVYAKMSWRRELQTPTTKG